MPGLGAGGPPAEIPRLPDLELSFDELSGDDLIGQGGNADVHLSEVSRGGESVQVAVKQPRFQGTLHPEVVERFREEATVWESLNDHENVVHLLDWGELPLPWLAMEYMDGGSLKDLLTGGALPPDQAAWVALNVCRAVRHAHRHGVAHLDLKPANVLFQSTGDAWMVPKVSDWGLARLMLDETGSVEGMSPQYAAPEQFAPEEHGSPDNRTDVYQLGAIVYELFVGEPPFTGPAPTVMRSVLDEQPQPPSAVADVPPVVDEAVSPALATEPADRYEDVLYLRDALEDVWEQLRKSDPPAGESTDESALGSDETPSPDGRVDASGSSRGESTASSGAEPTASSGAEPATESWGTDRPHQNLAVVGHVDHGKSTLVGRLLFETGAVPEHVVEQLSEETEERGRDVSRFAYVTDESSVERERGLTTDVSHHAFGTDEHRFTVVDCPGHRDFVGTMIVGTSQADSAVVVVAADDGVSPQTTEHVFLARTFGVDELVVAVTKMDVVDYDESRYREVVAEVEELLEQVSFDQGGVSAVPISAFRGDNVTEPSRNLSWWSGPTLLQALDELPVPDPPTDAPLRLPVRDVHSDTGAVASGRVETGQMVPADRISFQPSDVTAEVGAIEMHHEEVDQADPGDNVEFTLSGLAAGDVSRGDVVGPADDPPTVAETFTAQLVVMQHPSTISDGYAPSLHANTAEVACTFQRLARKVDPSTGEVTEEDPDSIQSGDAAIVEVRPQEPLVVEPSDEIPEFGSFAIRDMGQTIAAGRVIEVQER